MPKIGIWDDHDFGINDAGWQDDVEVRKTAFLDALGVDAAAPIRHRDGLYDAHRQGDVLVVMLDVRSFRQQTYLRQLECNSVACALANLPIRVLASFLTPRYFSADLLGEAQWAWLEKTLRSSTARVHVIVSPIQVSTPVALVESWQHFPIAKARLY